jgi:fructokinase
MSNIDRLYTRVPQLWADYVFASLTRLAPRAETSEREKSRTRLVRAAHGDSSGVRGAAWLWPVQ